MSKEMTELENILYYLETTYLEPHDDYTSEFTYKDQRILWEYINQLQQKNKQLKEEIQELKADYGTQSQVERDLLQMRIDKAKKYMRDNMSLREYDEHYMNLMLILKGDE